MLPILDKMKPFNPKKLDRDEKIIKAYYMAIDCYSLAQIGRELGVCTTTASTYLREGKEKYDQYHATNLNHKRDLRVRQILKLARERLDDLEAINSELANLSSWSGGQDDEDSGLELKVKQSLIRDKSYIIDGLCKLYQEASKLEGLYDQDRVDKFVTKKEENLNADIPSMAEDELLSFFNDLERGK